MHHIGDSSRAHDFRESKDLESMTTIVESMSLWVIKRRARSTKSRSLQHAKRSTRNSKRLETIQKMCEENAEQQLSFEQYLQDIMKELHARSIHASGMTFREELQVTL